MKTVTKQVYKFKKGQRVHLDEIYMIQGLAGGWFEEERTSERKGAGTLTDNLVITRDIKFTILIESI